MAKTWSAFYPYITHRVKGCADPVIDSALREAAREFCTGSLVWEDTRSLAVTGGTATYTLTLPDSYSEIAQVLSVADSTAPLTPVRGVDLDAFAGWASQTGVRAGYYLSNIPSAITLYPSPTASTTLTVRAAYKPSDTATGVEDFIFQSWRDVVVSGALHSLLMIPDESWSNGDAALAAGTMFRVGVSGARYAKMRGHMYGSVRVAPVKFTR